MKNPNVVVPTLVAIAGVLLVSRMGTHVPTDGYVITSAPTPYSNDHARVQASARPAEELPPTF
ncbi:MAG TPA: hypothetical protein VFK48_03845 [Usitatibacter sp.]|nr:hypothetical protein [Usitatibacter sp.]